MFNQKKEVKVTILISLQDQNKSTYGLISLRPSDVLDVSFNAVKYEVLITLQSSFQRGMTQVEPIQNVRVENQKAIPMPTYTQRELYNMEGYHHIVTVTDEKEMEEVWSWRGEDWNRCKELRESIVKQLADAKEALKKKEEELKKAQAEPTKQEEAMVKKIADAIVADEENQEAMKGKIVGLHGEVLTSEKTKENQNNTAEHEHEPSTEQG